MKVKKALLSVSDKEGIADFGKGLSSIGIQIISTGGTATYLKGAGIKVTEISTLTGFPELLDGRIKTINPIVHGGILAKRNKKAHMDMLKKYNISTIDLVACNLYPFETTTQKKNVTLDEVIENIDIGGPTLIRSAAKNYKDVIIVTNKNQYQKVLDTLSRKKNLNLKTRKQLATKAFAHTAHYDSLISTYLHKRWQIHQFPYSLTIPLRKKQDMRYGENPHQRAAFYHLLPLIEKPSISTAKKLHGKDLSYNNILDSDCAIDCILEFDTPSCVIIKHATPCGIASAKTLLQSWYDAYATDTNSPFGGIVSFNRMITSDIAEELTKHFLEVVIAPQFDSEALVILRTKKNLRLLEVRNLNHPEKENGFVLRSVGGGMLIQDRDIIPIDRKKWVIVTKKEPTKEELNSMVFAVKCVKHVKSNSVVFVKDTKTVGIGGGQTARVDAVWIATHKAKERITGSIMASDAFFPFRDAVDVAAQAGVKAIIQPGGSIRDDEVIQAANEYGISMVFSGQRYFRH